MTEESNAPKSDTKESFERLQAEAKEGLHKLQGEAKEGLNKLQGEAKKLKSKVEANPDVQRALRHPKARIVAIGGGVAAALVLAVLCLGGGGPSQSEVEDAVSRKLKTGMKEAIEAQAGMASWFGGSEQVNADKARALEKLDAIKVEAKIIEKRELDNGDWEVKTRVHASGAEDAGTASDSTLRLQLTKLDSGWKITKDEEL